MSDHADTIRRYLEDEFDDYSEAFAALDALVAERQQAIDERDAAILALHRASSIRERELDAEVVELRARCERAIDALREIARSPLDVPMRQDARDALVSLGETEPQKVWRCDYCAKSPEWPDGEELRPMGIGAPRCPNCDWKLRLVSLGETE